MSSFDKVSDSLELVFTLISVLRYTVKSIKLYAYMYVTHSRCMYMYVVTCMFFTDLQDTSTMQNYHTAQIFRFARALGRCSQQRRHVHSYAVGGTASKAVRS